MSCRLIDSPDQSGLKPRQRRGIRDEDASIRRIGGEIDERLTQIDDHLKQNLAYKLPSSLSAVQKFLEGRYKGPRFYRGFLLGNDTRVLVVLAILAILVVIVVVTVLKKQPKMRWS